MAVFISPFKGLHPKPEYVSEVIAPPYDVVTRAEAKQLTQNKPYNFLHISRAEIDLPDDMDEHNEAVYQQAKKNFERLIAENILEQDQNDCFYIYQLQHGSHKQTGVLAKASCKAYSAGKIRRHELTRPDKVLDRSQHIEVLGAQVSPTLLACKKDENLTQLLTQLTHTTPLLESALQEITHRIWRVEDPTQCEKISAALNAHETIYIADGHHRNEAAYQMYCKHPQLQDCLVAIFPENELKILGYHRVVKKLNSHTVADFLELLKKDFNVMPCDLTYPKQKGEIVLYVKNQAYQLQLHKTAATLDVDTLTEKVLAPLLAIHDIRQDKNIAFIGGRDALHKIKSEVDKGEFEAAFLLYPTSMQELLQVADLHQIMPPKSTWFEPKLADGLVSYRF